MTIKLTRSNMERFDPIRVGGIYKVMRYEHEWKDEPVQYKFLSDIETGWPGNMDSNIRLYHGWRGTTNNIYAEALGVFEVLEIVEQKNGLFRVKLSDDLHPEWD